MISDLILRLEVKYWLSWPSWFYWTRLGQVNRNSLRGNLTLVRNRGFSYKDATRTFTIDILHSIGTGTWVSVPTLSAITKHTMRHLNIYVSKNYASIFVTKLRICTPRSIFVKIFYIQIRPLPSQSNGVKGKCSRFPWWYFYETIMQRIRNWGVRPNENLLSDWSAKKK